MGLGGYAFDSGFVPASDGVLGTGSSGEFWGVLGSGDTVFNYESCDFVYKAKTDACRAFPERAARVARCRRQAGFSGERRSRPEPTSGRLLGAPRRAAHAVPTGTARPHLTLDEFREICARHGGTDPSKQASLARLLHKLPRAAALRRGAAAARHVGAQPPLGDLRRVSRAVRRARRDGRRPGVLHPLRRPRHNRPMGEIVAPLRGSFCWFSLATGGCATLHLRLFD